MTNDHKPRWCLPPDPNDVSTIVARQMEELEARGKDRTQQVLEIDEKSLAELRRVSSHLSFCQTTVGERFCGMLIKVVTSDARVVRVF